MPTATRRHRSKRFAFVAPLAFATVVVMAACGSSNDAGTPLGGDGGTTDGGSKSDGGGNPCDGLGCASMAGPVQIRVLDESGSPISSPTFEANGIPGQAVCETDAGQIIEDAGTCDPWTLDQLPFGSITISVSAPGYEPAAVTVTVSGPSGCCGIGPTVETSVTLSSLADASDDGPG